MGNQESVEIQEDVNIIGDFEKIIQSTEARKRKAAESDASSETTSKPDPYYVCPGTFQLFYFTGKNNVDFIVEVYPNGISHANEGYVSAKISTTTFRKSSLQCTLSVVDTENGQTLRQSESCMYSYQRINCLFERFVSHSTLLDRKGEVLPGGVLTLHCEMNCCYHVDHDAPNFAALESISVNDTYYEGDEITFAMPQNDPYRLSLTGESFRSMYERLKVDSKQSGVRTDEVDDAALLELTVYAGSKSSIRYAEDTYVIHDSELDRNLVGCIKYAVDASKLKEHPPGLLGLAYLHKARALRCTVKRFLGYKLLETLKQLRELNIYSETISKCREDTQPRQDTQSTSILAYEFISFQSHYRLAKLQDSFDVLKLYVAADRHQIEGVRNYCGAYLNRQMILADVCHLMMLAHDHHDEILKETISKHIVRNKDVLMLNQSWDILSSSQPDLVEEILATADAADDNRERPIGNVNRPEDIENLRRTFPPETFDFYN